MPDRVTISSSWFTVANRVLEQQTDTPVPFSILLFPSQTETAAYVIPHPALWVVDDGVESM